MIKRGKYHTGVIDMQIDLEQKVIFDPYKEHKLNIPVRLVIKDTVKDEFTHIEVLNPKETYELYLKDLDKHLLYKYKYQIKKNHKWHDHIPYENIIKEQENEDGIKYIFYPGKAKKRLFRKSKHKYLVVIFQGIKDLNRKSYYNYIKTLKDIDAPRLYIKDDYGTDEKTQTSYYLGPNKTFTIAEKVLKLIEQVRTQLGIAKKNVICAGSSKGGYAGLYFSHKGKYGYAVVGGPQVLVGNYLSKGKIDGNEEKSILPPILKYLAGEITIENIEWANNILFNVIKESNHEPTIYLHVGKGEPHYKHHVLPLMEFFKELGKRKIYLDLADYDTHKDLARHFPDFLINNINKICSK